jgi:transporter family-2 protein
VDRTSAAIFVVAAGAAVGAQAPMNGALGRVVGSWQAALVNFAVGLLILTVIVAVAAGGFGGLKEIPTVPWWSLLGGACGVAVVVAGMLAASVVIDRLGLFGVTEQPITAGKLLGIALLALGVYLIVRERA